MSELVCLGLDTALGACSAALATKTRVLAAERVLMRTGQAEAIAPMVARVLAAAGIEMAAIGRIGVTTGPGTFTGQRIGLSFARGLRLALGVPCAGVTTLEALAVAARARHPGRAVLAAIDARRGEVYAQGFGADGAALGDPALLSLAAAEDLAARMGAPVVAGSGGAVLPGLDADSDDQPDAAVIARLALERAAPDGPPAPFYLREADAKLPGPLKPLPPVRAKP